MKIASIFILMILLGCDAVQEKSGIVLDSETYLPIEGVAISKYEKEDPTNPYTRRIYSDENGRFEYSGVGGSNSFELYFMKDGYEVQKIENESSDTILLKPNK